MSVTRQQDISSPEDDIPVQNDKTCQHLNFDQIKSPGGLIVTVMRLCKWRLGIKIGQYIVCQISGRYFRGVRLSTGYVAASRLSPVSCGCVAVRV
jgi:hypothetical protein